MARLPAAVLGAAIVGALLATGLGACGPASAAVGDGVVPVVVAEDDWGSIAAQVGGPYVHVTSIITNPDADPHAYEPTAGDAAEVATARLVWWNGIGYDAWMPQLLAAAGGHPVHLDVGAVLGLPDGANPHRWYDPGDVERVVAAYVADLSRIDPRHAADFSAQARTFETRGLAAYHAEVAAIRSRYAGTPVGASESIFAVLAPVLGLDLLTPARFLRAVSEGTDVAAVDVATIDGQIRSHAIAAYVVNSQNTTPDVQAQLALCQLAGIPTATITETLVPATATWQTWQTRQLDDLAAALHRATGR